MRSTKPIRTQRTLSRQPEGCKKHSFIFQNSEDGESSPTLKERYEIFMNETSFTALTKIHKASSICKKFIWIILVLAMLIWLSIQCFWLLEKFFNYPVDVKIEMVSVPRMEFPSVTICNRNPLKKSKVKDSPFMEVWKSFEIKEDNSMYDKAVERFRERQNMDSGEFKDQDEFLASTVQTNGTTGNNTSTNSTKTVLSMMEENNFNMWDALDDKSMEQQYYKGGSQECSAMFAYSSIASTMTDAEIKKYGHSEKDLLMSCRWNGNPCSPKNFTYVYNVKYGNCYTFNHFNNGLPALETNYPGPLLGLVLEFNIEQKEYIPVLAPDSGLRVMIHERGSYPFLEDDGFLISPGFLTSVGISKTKISRLPAPHGKCSSHADFDDLYMKQYNVSYGKRSCLKSCYQEKFLTKCSCVVPWYKMPPNSKLCNYTDEDVSECLYDTMADLETCDEECPSPCLEYKYGETISMAEWPSDAYSNYLEKRIKTTHVDFMDKKVDLSSNLAKLEVFYRELVYENIDSQKGYESQNLISDIGGQLGLWLGLSAITVGELMEFFAAIGKAMTASAVKRKQTGPVKTPVEKF
ncbi:hypothetical protein KUTeg_017826 [Tegillarca granosa]|uniref:Uncharacterized protein n=1 Tax=Tegillarca granosa TaxID=220873 RepID=A0ABQ9ELV1_TEGGR|nr:hypothetical protein KUTeg_017826 [Tegillarca granosa]